MILTDSLKLILELVSLTGLQKRMLVPMNLIGLPIQRPELTILIGSQKAIRGLATLTDSLKSIRGLVSLIDSRKLIL